MDHTRRYGDVTIYLAFGNDNIDSYIIYDNVLQFLEICSHSGTANEEALKKVPWINVAQWEKCLRYGIDGGYVFEMYRR